MAGLKAVDLFSGAGGLSLGLADAGIEVVKGFDFDETCAATYERNLGHPGEVADVKEMKAADLPEVDVICGGPPCQGFSLIGKRKEDDPRNDLVWHFARLVGEARPRAFVMENVPGLGTGYGQKLLDALVGRFQEHGYAITKPVRLVDASAVGVPQKRKRLFILGTRRDQGVRIEYPEPFWNPPNVWEAIGDLPAGECEDVAPYGGEPLHEYARAARGDRTECSGNARSEHDEKVVALYESTSPGAVARGHRVPRLTPHGLCPTLRAGSKSEWVTQTAARPVHPYEPRCVTVRECARLHGYPDWFEFDETKSNAYRQIGNSVCPPVGRAVGIKVVRALG
jgi:DNA (cytosine-5)-methyltransferase 1